MTRVEFVRKDSWILKVIRDRCELTQAERAYLNIVIAILEQEPILDKIKEEIKDNTYFINETTEKEGIDFETVEKIIDKYNAESDIEKRKECPHKPCINYEDGCEEWAGCPCVYYTAESEEV